MFQNLSKSQHTLAAGIILGIIFAVTMAVSYIRGLDLITLWGIPLTASEIQGLLKDCGYGVFSVIGLGGLVGGFYASILTRSRKIFISIGLVLAFVMLVPPFYPHVFTFLGQVIFLIMVGPAIGGGIFIARLYQRLHSYFYLVPITVLTGIVATVIPWSISGNKVYLNDMRIAQEYAQAHQLSNYHVEHVGRGLFETGSAIYLEDDTMLKCGYDHVNDEMVETCVPFLE